MVSEAVFMLKRAMEKAIPNLHQYQYTVIDDRGREQVTWSMMRRHHRYHHVVNTRPGEDDILLITYDSNLVKVDRQVTAINPHRQEETFSFSDPLCFEKLNTALDELRALMEDSDDL